LISKASSPTDVNGAQAARPLPLASEMFNVNEAAVLLDVSPNYLRGVIARDEAPMPWLKVGRLIRIPKLPLLKLVRGEPQGGES